MQSHTTLNFETHNNLGVDLKDQLDLGGDGQIGRRSPADFCESLGVCCTVNIVSGRKDSRVTITLNKETTVFNLQNMFRHSHVIFSCK